ncbi:MAG: helix-turn-helix transcriptional regulator [Acetatifactor sp.]|nr:helix-turn-helix transcriptional regulator [Acetatifactor sp.]
MLVFRTSSENHMTQADLAGKINVTDKAVSRWERGLRFQCG